MSSRAVCIIFSVLLTACGGGGSSPQPPISSPQPLISAPDPVVPSVDVTGAVQKGPFLVGSTVLINLLDDSGRPTDSTIVTAIEDSIGSFSFSTDNRGVVQIVATGYYFSELTGQVSDSVLTLRSLNQLTDDPQQTAYVNIMTHLVNDRVLELIATGELSLAEALTQAESEFVVAFFDALPVSDISDFSALSVYDTAFPGEGTEGSIGNAYLLALSTAFYKYAETKAEAFGTTADAELTLILNQLSDDLADDGLLQTPGFLDEFVAAIRSLSPASIAENLRLRSIVDYPAGLSVPDISVFLNLCAGNFECAWRTAAPMPSPIRSHDSAVFGEKIFVFGGVTPPDTETLGLGSEHLTDVYEYDPLLNRWTPKAPMPIGSFDLEAHTIGDKIFVMAAYGANGFRNEVWEYDPVNDTWLAKTPKPTYRYEFGSAAVDGKIYVIGGVGTIDDGPWESGKPWEFKDYVEIYDPALDEWSVGQAAPVASASAEACVFGGEIYLFGGRTDGGGLEAFVYNYNPSTDMWSAKSPMLHAREGHRCVSLGDEVYLMGGRDSDGTLDLVERYDPLVDSWVTRTRLPTARHWFSVSAIGDQIFTFGGSSDGRTLLDVVEVFSTSETLSADDF